MLCPTLPSSSPRLIQQRLTSASLLSTQIQDIYGYGGFLFDEAIVFSALYPIGLSQSRILEHPILVFPTLYLSFRCTYNLTHTHTVDICN